MKRIKIGTVLFVMITICATSGFGQNSVFVSEMEAALELHKKAKNFSGEWKSIQAFERLSERYENEWLPDYWASYLYTQVARLKGRIDDFPEDETPLGLIEESQKRLDRAKSRVENLDSKQRSDFHMLQGFIYEFNALYHRENKEMFEKNIALRDEEFKAAARENSENPLAYVLIGIELMGGWQPTREVSYKDIIAGIALLEHARRIMDSADYRSQTTYWNRDFINFWQARGEERLTESLQADPSSGS